MEADIWGHASYEIGFALDAAACRAGGIQDPKGCLRNAPAQYNMSLSTCLESNDIIPGVYRNSKFQT